MSLIYPLRYHHTRIPLHALEALQRPQHHHFEAAIPYPVFLSLSTDLSSPVSYVVLTFLDFELCSNLESLFARFYTPHTFIIHQPRHQPGRILPQRYIFRYAHEHVLKDGQLETPAHILYDGRSTLRPFASSISSQLSQWKAHTRRYHLRTWVNLHSSITTLILSPITDNMATSLPIPMVHHRQTPKRNTSSRACTAQNQ